MRVWVPSGFEPRGYLLAASRALLAGAALTVLLFTPDGVLFAYEPNEPSGIRCDGIRAISLWCIAGPTAGARLACRLVVMTLLVLVVAGVSPRWTCIPHAYVGFGMSVSMMLPNGGEQVAQIATMLLVPACLGDRRWCAWVLPDRPLSPIWQGSACGGLLFLRLQVAVVYATASLGKLANPRWRDGTAMYNIAFDPTFGLPTSLLHLAWTMLSTRPWLQITTWSVVVAELVLAVLVLFPHRVRGLGLGLAVALHGAIIVGLGLFSFGLVMIAVVAAAYAGWSPVTYRLSVTHGGSHCRRVGGRIQSGGTAHDIAARWFRGR